MEKNKIKYPIGVRTFRDIVEGRYLYIDKTGIAHELAENYKYVFLSRPRRFGKSLLSSTFHSYFAGEEELFNSLKAGELNKEWTTHPVLHLDASPEFSGSILPLLYQTGYVTIKGYNAEDESYTLGYPNREVREGFLKGLLNSYRGSEGMSASFVLQFNRALKNNDINGALERMQSFLAGIPYNLENKSEKHFQTIIHLIFSLLGHYTQAEVKSAIGRADAVCWTKDRPYVFEFKVDGSAEEALKQIDEKGYLIPYTFEGLNASTGASANSATPKDSVTCSSTLIGSTSGSSPGTESDSAAARALVKVGVNISTPTRTIESWKVAEE